MKIRHLFPRLLFVLSAIAAGAPSLPALDDKRNQEIFRTVGRDTGQSLVSTTDDAAVAEVRAIAEKLRLNLGNALAWKPTAEQIAAIAATPEDAAMLAAYTEAIYAELAAGKPAAKAGQTEIRVTGPDWKALPGGYTQQRAHFKEGVKVYGFKYLEPGKDAGMSFDGLFKVEGKWVFIPKAWRAYRKPAA